MNTAQPLPSHNQPEYSVTEISSALKRTVEDTFGYVRIRGELSGLRRPSSGHLYMDLKDEKSVLASVCWKGNVSKFTFKPEDGLEVICTGKITTYAGQSKYQLVVESMEPAGLGALMALLEKRKKEMAAEGLFSPERKKPLPFMPQHIGVVTSPTGAVIRDILHRIADRFPVHVTVWPVRVQGQGAAEEITAAIRGFNALPAPKNKSTAMSPQSDRPNSSLSPESENLSGITKPDLLIVARGGGSMEDLWCFNEENVVRAAADSTIPLISAVGHETDTTLIDYVSDQRAPTPTAAAEMAVPVRSEWIATLDQWGSRLNQRMLQQLQHRQERVEGFARAIPNPAQLLSYATQRLDDWAERLQQALPAYVDRQSQRLTLLLARLRPQDLLRQIDRDMQQSTQLSTRLTPLIERRLRDAQEALTLQSKLFDSLNYHNVLKRGFALVRSESGAVVSSAQTASQEASLMLHFADGDIQTFPQAATKTKKPKKNDDGNTSSQSTLF